MVEGEEDKRVIPQLIEAYGIPWGKTRATAIVDIEAYDGIENLMAAIGTELQASDRKALGIVVDADEDGGGRWQRLRQACARSIPNCPETLPPKGLVVKTDNDIQFGVWMMPDNCSRGMLETFLMYLVPDPTNVVWEYAQVAFQEAQNLGAPFREAHRDKARIHTWLAWQDPPGQQLHSAVMQKILRPGHPTAQAFIDWFRALYDIQDGR
jgi:hypothetical protein